MKNKIKSAVIVLFWIILWQFLSLVIKNNIIFASPLMVIRRLAQMATETKFWIAVFNSLFRIVLGFLIAFFAGYVCGFISGRFKLFGEVLSPLVLFFKSVPVASVVVLLLICFGGKWLSVYVTFMVVFPNVYINLMEAVSKTDVAMLEMADAYKLTYVRRWIYIIGQTAAPLLLGAVRLSIGMSFKSGVAAEVIGICNASIGELLYMSKIYIDTAGVMAITLVIVVLSYLCEKAIVAILTVLIDTSMRCTRSLPVLNSTKPSDIKLKKLSIGYDEGVVIRDMSLSLEAGCSYVITGESGVGKTTLIKYISGRQADCNGHYLNEARDISIQYQEDRLIDRMSIISNLLLVRSNYSRSDIIKLLDEILPGTDINKRVSECSGGMKRRLSLVRALISQGQLLVLDEPFSGLDEDNKEKVRRLIHKYKGDRTLLIATHDTRNFDMNEFCEIAINGV